MSIGKMNTFINIISTAPTKDAEGFVTTGDNTLAAVRAYKEDRHGNEKWANNQSILIQNLKHKDTPKPLLTDDEVELLTSPLELAAYKDAIVEAMFKGTKRNIESEEDEKNAIAG